MELEYKWILGSENGLQSDSKRNLQARYPRFNLGKECEGFLRWLPLRMDNTE